MVDNFKTLLFWEPLPFIQNARQIPLAAELQNQIDVILSQETVVNAYNERTRFGVHFVGQVFEHGHFVLCNYSAKRTDDFLDIGAVLFYQG